MNINSLAAVVGLLACGLLSGPAWAARQQTGGFPDVPKTHWAYEAVTDLKMRGILVGYPPETPSVKPAITKPASHASSASRRPVRKRALNRRNR